MDQANEEAEQKQEANEEKERDLIMMANTAPD
jgi:hypothetical protein